MSSSSRAVLITHKMDTSDNQAVSPDAKQDATSDIKKYDLVIYGASGYTGQYVVEEVGRVAADEATSSRGPITWAVAGRNKDKLTKALQTARDITELPLADVGIIIANSDDDESLQKMASLARIVINVVGPYQKYGQQVVKACIENGTSHVDISGEPQFMEGMQLRYNKEAELAGVHIVNACGYDSVPAELGVKHCMDNFKGELNSVECYVKTNKSSGAVINTGTMESAALIIANNEHLKVIRKLLYVRNLPQQKYPLVKRAPVHKESQVLNKWAVPLPGDEPQVYRTQRYRHDVLKQRPIQFHGYMCAPSLGAAVGLLFGMMYFVLISYFSLTRYLLLKFPEKMTGGIFNRNGPKRELLKDLKFTSTLIGRGWSEKLSEYSDEHTKEPDASIVVKVTGPDPGYGATSLMMVACAMTILKEKQNCTGRGGVMTPGTAFMNTNIIQRLQDRGMTFTVQ